LMSRSPSPSRPLVSPSLADTLPYEDPRPPTALKTLEEEPSIQVVEKKRKVEDVESKKRGKRMFGVLMGTLNKFKEEGNKQSDATKRRQNIENRLTQKLREEQEENARRIAKEQEVKNLKTSIIRKEDEIATLDGIYATRAKTKLSLASFLCTKYPISPAFPSSSLSAPVHPSLPHILPPNPSINSSNKPLYYLPRRLTTEQADLLDTQRKEIRDEIEQEKQKWKLERKRLEEELDELKEKKREEDENHAREERIKAQERRREQEMMDEGAITESKEDRREGEMDEDRRETDPEPDRDGDVKMGDEDY